MTSLLWLIGPYGRRVLIAIALMGAVATLWTLHNRRVIKQYESDRAAAAVPAHLGAADQRTVDSAIQASQKEAYEQAIRHAPNSGAPSPVAISLNCERLRRAKLVDLPAACGR